MMMTNVEPVIYIACESSDEWQLIGIDISKAGKIYCLRVESSILIFQQVIAISVNCGANVTSCSLVCIVRVVKSSASTLLDYNYHTCTCGIGKNIVCLLPIPIILQKCEASIIKVNLKLCLVDGY